MNINVREFMDIAIRQNGYKESPPNSNNTKYGKWIGMNYQPWCASYEAWCGNEASDVFGGDNPVAKSANAAYIQDLTVSQKHGTWIMKKTASNATKLSGQKKAKEGDIVDFDFGANDLYRRHTGLVIGVIGDKYVTIEGNTSADDRCSQSNGGMVAIRHRSYKDVCSIVRPKFGKYKKHKPTEPFDGKLPKLPKKGWFELGDHGRKVKKLQKALNWITDFHLKEDGKFGNCTLACVFRFQIDYDLIPDGEFGHQCMTKLSWLVEKYRVKEKVEDLPTEDEKDATTGNEGGSTPISEAEVVEDKPKKKTYAEKIVAKAKECSYAYGTKKEKYAMPTGKPKKEYKQALDRAYPDRSHWGFRPRHGRSCDVFVGTVVRDSGVDPNFPRGLDEVIPYVKNHPKKWKLIKNPKRGDIESGDIIYQIYKSGAGHICIKMKAYNRIANAHYVKNTYPIIQAYSNIVKDAKDCRQFYVIRRK